MTTNQTKAKAEKAYDEAITKARKARDEAEGKKRRVK